MSDFLSPAEAKFLDEAAAYLENPSFLMRVADYVGKPVDFVTKNLPAKVTQIGETALTKAMEIAVSTVREPKGEGSFDDALQKAAGNSFWHTLASVGPAVVGGPFGVAGLAFELPLTTGIMFRSIASAAAAMGEDLEDPLVRLDCLTVFSQGGPGADDDAMESSYLTTRLSLAYMVREAAGFVSTHTARQVAEALATGGAPQLTILIARIAARFNVVVSQKFLAQSLPVVAIATGALVNAAFCDHFGSIARYHFGIRRLERQHGQDRIQDAYRQIVRRLKGK